MSAENPANPSTPSDDQVNDAPGPAQLPATNQGPSRGLVVGGNEVEIEGLAPAQVQELKLQYAKGILDVQQKASDLKVDVDALEHTLHALTSESQSANESGLSITATHTQNTSLGRTEIIIGNTDRASKGRLSNTQSGAQENPLIYAAIAIGVTILIALIVIAV